MIGARTGDRILFLGAGHPGLVAELALTTGLNGEVRVAAPAARHAGLEQAATRAGALLALVAWDAGPVPAGSREFDLAIWADALSDFDPEDRQTRVNNLLAALRPGGRALLVDGVPPQRFGGGRSRPVPEADAIALLERAGAVAARRLATTGQLTYYEARRPR